MLRGIKDPLKLKKFYISEFFSVYYIGELNSEHRGPLLLYYLITLQVYIRIFFSLYLKALSINFYFIK